MSERPTVSVVMPAYNGARYIGEALESVLQQDYRPLEVVVVDDGSTDGTAGIVRSFAGVRYLRQDNRGPGAARNLGIRESQGPFLAFLDQDDLWLPGKLSAQMARLTEDEGLGFTVTLHETFLEDGIRPRWMSAKQVHDQHGFLPSMLVVRRQVFERVGDFDERMTCSSDAEWFFRVKDARVRFERVPCVLVRRRAHATNQSNAVATLHRELLSTVRQSIRRQRERS